MASTVKRARIDDEPGEGVLSTFSRKVSESSSSIRTSGKQAASDASFVLKKLYKSTSKATWYFATTMLVLVIPLVIVMDREQVAAEMEAQNAALLGTPSPSSK